MDLGDPCREAAVWPGVDGELCLLPLADLANIGLDIWFVWGMGFGAYGVGLGTACAEAVAWLEDA